MIFNESEINLGGLAEKRRCRRKTERLIPLKKTMQHNYIIM